MCGSRIVASCFVALQPLNYEYGDIPDKALPERRAAPSVVQIDVWQNVSTFSALPCLSGQCETAVLLLGCHSLSAAAGGCKAGGAGPTSVVGTALVIENSTQATDHALKAEADCLLEGANTYQVGVMLCAMHSAVGGPYSIALSSWKPSMPSAMAYPFA